MKKIALTCLLLAALLSDYRLSAEGCVAIRSTGGFCTAGQEQHLDTAAQWQLTINNCYYKSFKHYIGANFRF